MGFDQAEYGSGKPVDAAAAGAGGIVASARMVPPGGYPIGFARKRRRVADVFVGGVINTRLAWARRMLPCWLGLEPGRKLRLTAPLVGVRMTEEFQAEIKIWSKKQPDDPPFAAAIRRLVKLGLTVTAPARPVSKPDRRLRAAELAARAIDKIADPAAPPEERAQRQRRLTKGPEEFREVRVDRPKAKGK